MPQYHKKACKDDDVKHWKELQPGLLQGYKPKHTFNTNETRLLYHLIPSKTFSMNSNSSKKQS
jgi:hypothetical protein